MALDQYIHTSPHAIERWDPDDREWVVMIPSDHLDDLRHAWDAMVRWIVPWSVLRLRSVGRTVRTQNDPGLSRYE